MRVRPRFLLAGVVASTLACTAPKEQESSGANGVAASSTDDARSAAMSAAVMGMNEGSSSSAGTGGRDDSASERRPRGEDAGRRAGDATASVAGSTATSGAAAGIGGRTATNDGAAVTSQAASGAGAGHGAQSADTTPTSSANGCPVKLEGFAAVESDGVATTTGGGDTTPVTVTTFADLLAAAQDTAPRVIIISGTIKTTDGGGSAMTVASNKTIMGADKDATLYGGINMSNVDNVIIRNLNIHGTWPDSGPDDTVASHGSHHIWYDHLNIWDSTDGSLDITNQSNYQTVSWTKFWYTSSSHPHRLASLNGSGGGDHPEDSRYLKVTYHHNWWGKNVNERMPRVMYGKGHQYNNYFNASGNTYCIGVGSFGSIVVENNYFQNVKDPHVLMYDWHAFIAVSGNIYDNTTGKRDMGMLGTRATNDPMMNSSVEDAAAFKPPYAYALDKAADVPALDQKCAGPQ